MDGHCQAILRDTKGEIIQRNETRISPGKPMPYGATPGPRGTQFSVFSRNATSVSLLFFDKPEDSTPALEVPLDPGLNKTGDMWHAEVDGVGPGAFYLYRVDGPYDLSRGHRFDRTRLLLDPYAKAVAGSAPPRGAGLKGIVIRDDYDWRGDRPLGRSMRTSVIYETHVRSLTCGPGSGVEHPGTFRGVTEKIPYLQGLGITAIELLPVQEFDEHENSRRNPITGEQLRNYWGYSTISFFAPKGGYSSAGALGQQVVEFKDMVRELHAAGIEVILDVVFNHTAEGDETGPTLSFRGLDNTIYYMLDGRDPSRYRNFSGCGNTLNCNHPIVRSLIIDCLRYWVVEMHVDGFRFDLGSVLGRDLDGNLLANPPVLQRIAEEPVLRHTKIIAEAWDAAGAYQVGWFPGGRWAEWNDRFRDDVRRYWRGGPGTVPGLATRLAGSSDLYLRDGRKPFHSINFVCSHDGFTVNDLVSYERKHNEENGEGNRDGLTPDHAANHGVEGPTDDPRIESIRNRQVKNFLATLLLSLGTPMLLGGDEFRRTQRGNNNPWCQDNAISWYDWSFLARHGDVHRFVRELIRFRLAHPAFLRPEFYSGRDAGHNRIPDITWLTEEAAPADWAEDRNTLTLLIDGNKADIEADRDDNDILMLFNAKAEPARFVLPPVPPGKEAWFRVLDTGVTLDVAAPGLEERVFGEIYRMAERSMAVFLSR